MSAFSLRTILNNYNKFRIVEFVLIRGAKSNHSSNRKATLIFLMEGCALCNRITTFSFASFDTTSN